MFYGANQARTCKTLGIVTKPKPITTTHAQMRPRNIIHARRFAPKGAAWAWSREYEEERLINGRQSIPCGSRDLASSSGLFRNEAKV